MKFKKVVLSGVCAAALVVGTVAGTMAWLQDETDEVTNTFTIGEIALDLDESKATWDASNAEWDLDANTRVNTNEYEHVYPGAVINKDPLVTVDPDSEKSWVFIQVTDGGEDAITWSVASGWTKLEDGVYWRVFDPEVTTDNGKYEVIADNKVYVSDEAVAGETFSAIVFKAYAIQYQGFASAESAWDELKEAVDAA